MKLEWVGRLLADWPLAMRLVGADGEVALTNAEADALPDALFGHRCHDAPASRASCPACQRGEILAGGGSRRWYTSYAGRHWDVVQCPVRDAEGRAAYVLEMYRDDTVALTLQSYLISEAERQEGVARASSAVADRLSAELGELQATQTDFLYHDRLAAMGQLAASLAHEIHTPLGAMISSIDQLRRGVARVESAVDDSDMGALVSRRVGGLRRHAELIGEGARRIQSVVRTLQVFYRLDEAPLQTVDLHAGLDSTIDLLRFRMGDRIVMSRDYGRLPAVTCRPDAINQVFMNLLQNAIQAIAGRGTITVTTRPDGDGVTVAVADSGHGISPDDLPNIFRLGFTTRGGELGSGIGLPLSRRIVEEHGGTIRVASAAGEGATFTVRLPVTPPPVPAADDEGDAP